MAASAAADSKGDAVAVDELLAVPNCRAVLIGASPEAGSEAAAPVIQFAEGTLRVCQLPPSPGEVSDVARRTILTIASDLESVGNDAGFFYPLLPGTPVYCTQEPASKGACAACITLPDPEGQDSYGVLFDALPGFDSAIALLETCGCTVKRGGSAIQQTDPPAGYVASKAAGAVEQIGSTLTSAIMMGGGALSWGIRQATASSKTSPLMEPTSKPVHVPEAAKKGVGQAREISKQVVHVSGQAMDAVARLASSAAGKASAAAAKAAGGGGTSGAAGGWVADAKYVGGASLGAGVSVFMALNAAADLVVQEALGSGAELVGHKFGEEAGATTREGFHVVGNVMAAKSLMSSKAVGTALGKRTAAAAAVSAADAWIPSGSGQGAAPAAALNGQASPSPGGGGIVLGPKPA